MSDWCVDIAIRKIIDFSIYDSILCNYFIVIHKANLVEQWKVAKFLQR